jgi:hypothetical protein
MEVDEESPPVADVPFELPYLDELILAYFNQHSKFDGKALRACETVGK